MEVEALRFQAKSDDGQIFTVIVYQRYKQQAYLSGETETVKTMKRYVLTNGVRLTPKDSKQDPETFEIVETHQIIRKIR